MNTNIYNGYMTGEERELAVQEATLMNEFDKLCMIFEMRDMQLQQNCKDAELKVFAESGTYDDLQYLIEAAAEEVQEQKQGLLSKIVATLKSLLAKIVGGFKKLFGAGNPDDELDVDKGQYEKVKGLSAVKGEINGLANDVKSGNWGGIIEKAKKVLPVLVGVTAAGVATGQIIKKKRSEVESDVKPIEEMLSNIQNAVNSGLEKIVSKLPDSVQNIAKDGIAKVKEILKPASDIINIIKGFLLGKMGGSSEQQAGNSSDPAKKKHATAAPKPNGDMVTPVTFNSKDSYSYTGDKKYRIYKNGKIQVKGDNGVYMSVLDLNSIPAGIKNAATFITQKNKPVKTESAEEEIIDMREIRELVGEGYKVECTEDYIEITECVEISKEDSIFGSSVASDIAMKESQNAEHSAEFEKLKEMINSL